MEHVELLTVDHTFWIARPGLQMLVLSPTFSMPQNWTERGWMSRAEAVLVERPDGRWLKAASQINVTHLNIRDVDVPLEARWPIVMWLTDRTPEEVPVGSKIWVSPEVKNALLPTQTA